MLARLHERWRSTAPHPRVIVGLLLAVIATAWISDSEAFKQVGDAIAEYAYAGVGVGRKVRQTYGYDGSSSTHAAQWLAWDAVGSGAPPPFAGSYDALDTFGRTAHLHYRDGQDGTLWRAKYAYDASDNRLWQLIATGDGQGGLIDNQRSSLFGYDALDRLVSSELGALDLTDPQNPSIGASTLVPVPRVHAWALDSVGNWAQHTLTADDGSGQPQVTTADQLVNLRNELESIDDGDGDPLNDVQLTYDAAGSLTSDQTYNYHYDGLGRLVQVDEIGAAPGGADQWILHHTYDGVGRLVRTQSPYPGAPNGELRTERFHYDGVRRIQELVTDPILSQGGAESSGDPELVLLASQSVPPGSNPDGSAAPATLEEGLMDGPGGGGTPNRQMDREYVWGPGDGGVDELLVQYDRTGAALFAIQDDSGDLVALCDLGGPNSDGRVVAQWTYDPYGAVLSAEHLHAFAYPHLGHKGLFFDRLDVPVVDGSGNENPRLVPFGHNIYYNRNRAYSPQLGRFMQMDPNQTAMTLLEAASYHGRGMGALALAFDLGGLYGDGANLYEYLGSNPVMRSDPLGLAYDPFDMVDDYLAASAGERAAFLSKMGKDALAAAAVTASIVSYLPIPVVGNLGDLALYALGEQSGDELAAAVALGIVPGGKLAGKLGNFLGRIGSNAFQTASRYVRGGGASRFSTPTGLIGRAARFLDRKPKKVACGCFSAATLVWTPAGAVPIDDLIEQDDVYAAPDDGGVTDVQIGTVGAKIIVGEASLLRLTIRHADGSLETINTTDEHPFHVVESGEWTRADGLRPGDRLSAINGPAVVIALSFGAERVPVYNLSIPGSPTYFVGEGGVWVHNCGTIRGSRGFEHSFGRHADEWAQRWGGKVNRAEWLRILENANNSSVMGFGSVRGTKTVAKFARIDGNKPILSHCFAERAGEFATAYIPTSGQIQQFFRTVE